MADAQAWAALAREWLKATSPRAAQAMREQEQEAARRRRDWRPGEHWRGKRADADAAQEVEQVRWATEPEPAAGPSEEEIERARTALEREMALARARARARQERGQ
ncbi:hypothetical protein [Nonomuraea wenchangensis]|uniref:Uncharacterized protein n=1 Tax=Nonomuraea wenchangensis TaxID=568860 RepID=A0A1I0LV19_9ACTN|nr:hypothetical protein [Nonomuraea wenchangensis]SEU46754.1 hypothetical protein SAMN05421811_127137 [Nonomuraea wenchangensis]